MQDVIIRMADEGDASRIRDIYASYVTDTFITFEVEPPTADEIAMRIRETTAGMPWIVCAEDSTLLGYAYASRHHERAAYQWSVDVSIYVAAEHRGIGVGRALYTSLFRLLRLRGVFNAYAGIALPNEASVGLHEALGFRLVGIYRSVGYKLGAWRDVGWWHLLLAPLPAQPVPPPDFADVKASSEWSAAMLAGVSLLRPTGSRRLGNNGGGR